MGGASDLGQTPASSSRSFVKYGPAVHDVNLILPPASQLHLPTVIVVGDRSHGKSSLMEKATKCNIFPVDEERCTRMRMPIRLQMKYVFSEAHCTVSVTFRGITTTLAARNDVLGKVQQIMEEVPPNVISSEEVTVQICQVGCQP